MTVLPTSLKIRLSLLVFPFGIGPSLNVFLGKKELCVEYRAASSSPYEVVPKNDVFYTFECRITPHSPNTDGHPVSLINIKSRLRTILFLSNNNRMLRCHR